MGLDGHRVLDIFAQGDVSNISTCYFKPRHAFDGLCHSKDIRAKLYEARHRDFSIPLI